MTHSQISKEIQKTGMLINKDKLIEHIKKIPQTTFPLLQSPNAKEMIVIIDS